LWGFVVKKGSAILAELLTMTPTLAKDKSQLASIESVGAILTRCKTSLIDDWLVRTKKTPELSHPHLDLSDSDRTEHLPNLIDDLVACLGRPKVADRDYDAIPSLAAVEHGRLRRAQGYSTDKLIHESRILQVTIFGILHENLSMLDFDLLLPDVMIVAHELDTHLMRTLDAFENPGSKSAVD
jgi:hypothetical protein